jgi:hypothetical protein
MEITPTLTLKMRIMCNKLIDRLQAKYLVCHWDLTGLIVMRDSSPGAGQSFVNR